MRTSIWFRTEECNPPKSGTYLCYRGFGIGGMGDGDRHLDWRWYDAKKNSWQEYRICNSVDQNLTIYYWTDAMVDDWINEDPPSKDIKGMLSTNPTIMDAWKEVERAIERFQIVKNLVE